MLIVNKSVPMTNHIRLPAERIEQLRRIAQAKEKTITEVIADYVRSEIAAGTIPASVPGFDVASEGASITIRANGFEASVPMGEGPTVADLLKEAGSANADPERKKRWIEGAAAMSGMTVKRAGNGLKLVSPITGREFPLNLDIAADLAEQIERAAE
ncbi:hypothetical protein [Szabonella alba]|uniref:Uncharacterized protein n=1 Tax=Szabonella alba TaxID=2804194 RepID=A0A8K0VCY8_9RHOB|nr:hypothetical protein [Szabonella alba]MBL4917444.1 hypothetical protein [Szabonella alba]